MDTGNLHITSEFVRLIAEIDEFKGAWRAWQNHAPERLNLLRRVATIESIASSTRIEGVKLTDRQVEQLLSGIRLTSFRSRDEEEVVGYADAMEMVFESHEFIPIKENYIKQLHKVLLKYSTKDIRHRGEYKKFPNHVEAFDSEGKSLGVIFETATPFDTPRRMEELIEWVNREVTDKRTHILIVIAIFIVHFLAIHPFQDGNGRLSRILTALMLLKAGYSYVPYSSLERIIEENKDRYYLALRRAQSTLSTDNSQLNEWTLFFLQSLKKQVEVLEGKLEMEKQLLVIPQLSQAILSLVREHGRVSVRHIQAMTKANRNTIKAHLKSLVQKKFLVLEGKGKGSWYRAA